jgi:hypothetical protein
MKTSCFRRYTGDNGVAISISVPIGYTGAQFPALAPDKNTFYSKKSGEIDETQYEKQYRERVLANLDASDIYDIFSNSVLLCWENPVFDNDGKIINKDRGFCHRYIVSQWIEEELGIEVPEWNPSDEKKISKNKPLF